MTEDIHQYVERKRYLGVHGNHLEIQALSEMYSRAIHIYCYSEEPINIFQQAGMRHSQYPIRLSYHRECHYNALVDPHKASVGVGLGLPNFSPGAADKNLMQEAFQASEEDLVEKAMLEDKIKATDWEATNEAIEEQVARESYLQWLRDNERRHAGEQRRQEERQDRIRRAASSATVTSQQQQASTPAAAAAASSSATVTSGDLVRPGAGSPQAGCSFARAALAGNNNAFKPNASVSRESCRRLLSVSLNSIVCGIGGFLPCFLPFTCC